MEQNLNSSFFHYRKYNLCLLCTKLINTEAIFCIDCYKQIYFIGSACKTCGIPLHRNIIQYNFENCIKCIQKPEYWHLDAVKSLFIYKGFGKKLVLRLKALDDQYIYNTIAQLIYKNHYKFFYNIDFIIPISLHWKKKIIRGFDQNILLSEKFALISKVNLEKNILKRIKNTQSQGSKSYRDRFLNLKDSFLIKNHDIIKNKNILLIDDVITTGATSNECAKVIKESGANSVKLLTIARTILSDNIYDY